MSPAYTALLNAQAATASIARIIAEDAIAGRPILPDSVATFEDRKVAEAEAERAWIAADLDAPLGQVR